MSDAGIDFKTFSLEGLPFFKNKTVFDLSRKGISLILGKNLDSSNDNPNGAGKSLFFAELAELLTNEPTIGVRTDVIRKGTRELTFTKDGHSYRVVRSFSPKEKFSIFKNGKDLEFRELSAAKEAFRKLIPYSPSEVLSLLYIDSRIPHPLVRGSGAQRRDFFLRFFRMNVASNMRKVVKDELDKLKLEAGAYREILSSIKELKTEIQDKDLDSLESTFKSKSNKVKQLEVKVKKYNAVADTVKTFTSYSEELSRLEEIGVTSLEDSKKKTSQLESKLESIETELNAWAVYNEWSSSQEDHEKELSRLKDIYGDKSPTYQSGLLEKKEEAEKQILKLRDRISSLKSRVQETSERNQERKQSQLDRLKEEAKKLKESSSTCPTCGSAWDNKHALKELKANRKLREEIEAEIADMIEANSAAAKSLVEVTNSLEDQLSLVSRLQTRIDEFKEFRRLLKKKAPVKPERTKSTLRELRSKYNDLLQNTLAFASRSLKAKSEYLSLSKEDVSLAKSEDPTSKYLSLMEEVNELKVELHSVKQKQEDLDKLRQRKAKLKSQLAELPALELLYEALSKKGVEALQIKTITDRLSQVVNKYAKLVFPEDYEFSFDMSSQYAFLVKRKYGKKTEVSDVRKLSGAESLMFNLILFIALLSFVPKNLRPSILIMDEPTANFGPEMIDSFVKFLPVLNSVVKHIIVITPMPYAKYENAKVWTVVKKNGVSSFHEGIKP